MPTQGILYVATSREYLREARHSAESVIQYNPEVNICVVTAECIADKADRTVFDDVVTIEDPHDDLRDRPPSLHKSPYNKTLYLDNDVFITGDISELFELLDRVDLAVSKAANNTVNINRIPSAFAEFNLGVILYSYNQKTKKFIDRFINNYMAQISGDKKYTDINVEGVNEFEEISSKFGILHDQVAFREALYQSDLSYHVLPDEYNFKGSGSSVDQEVKILHFGDYSQYKQKMLINHINDSTSSTRVLWKNKLLYYNGKNYNLISRIEQIRRLCANTLIPSVLESIGMKEYVNNMIERIK